jgi:MFS family permease
LVSQLSLLSVSALTPDYLDKTTLSYASVFGLIEDANLDPNSDQYSWLGSIVYIAQLVMQPLVAYFLVRFPIGKFVGIMVLTWGAILCGMAGATDFKGLMATRFLLGAFEAAVGKFCQICRRNRVHEANDAQRRHSSL